MSPHVSLLGELSSSGLVCSKSTRVIQNPPQVAVCGGNCRHNQHSRHAMQQHPLISWCLHDTTACNQKTALHYTQGSPCSQNTDDVFEAAGSAYQVFNSCWSSSQLGLHNAIFWQRVWLPCTHFLYYSLHTAHAVMEHPAWLPPQYHMPLRYKRCATSDKSSSPQAGCLSMPAQIKIIWMVFRAVFCKDCCGR